MSAGGEDNRRREPEDERHHSGHGTWSSHQSRLTKKEWNMIPQRSIIFLARTALVPLAALAVVGVGGGVGQAGASTVSHAAATKPKAAVRVTKTSLGKTLVDSQGRTVYLFTADSGTTSACTGACATAWPPLMATGTPTVGSGAKAKLIGTTTRADGSRQVTYKGHPLYLFSKDQKAGDTNGEGLTAFGGSWFGLSPAGTRISPSASTSSSTSNSGGSSSSGGLGY
jgi:predicted lipoprotein with Yx(FWY)xxD motif